MEIEKVILDQKYEKYLQNQIQQQRMVPGNYSYSNATQRQKRKTVVIGDSQFKSNK